MPFSFPVLMEGAAAAVFFYEMYELVQKLTAHDREHAFALQQQATQIRALNANTTTNHTNTIELIKAVAREAEEKAEKNGRQLDSANASLVAIERQMKGYARDVNEKCGEIASAATSNHTSTLIAMSELDDHMEVTDAHVAALDAKVAALLETVDKLAKFVTVVGTNVAQIESKTSALHSSMLASAAAKKSSLFSSSSSSSSSSPTSHK